MSNPNIAQYARLGGLAVQKKYRGLGRKWAKLAKRCQPMTESEFIDHSVPEPNTGCWIWLKPLNASNGYGNVRSWRGKRVRPHCIFHEIFKGPIPDGLEIDHLCRNRWCVNPDHLEAVTPLVNWIRGMSLFARRARATHCFNGHPWNTENTYMRPDTDTRQCKQCGKDRRERIRNDKRR